MNFDTIPAGTSIFVDANIFVYAFANDLAFEAPCVAFLERVESRELKGFTAASVLSEFAHRLMTLEACETFGWSYRGIGQKLRRHPAQVGQLHRFREALDDIVATGMTVIPISERDVLRAGILSQQHGMLSNDALILASMESHQLKHLASNDADFDRVQWLTRYAPA